MNESERPNHDAEPAADQSDHVAALPPPPPVPVRASVRALNGPADRETRPSTNERVFAVDGVEWRATIVGESAYGTGARSLGYLIALRFQRLEDEEPSREALLPRGRFEMLYDEELATLLDQAVPI